MSANRHLGRVIVLQTLYEIAFRKECGDKKVKTADVTNRNIARYSGAVDDKQFVKNLVNGIVKGQKEIDDQLRPLAIERPLEQIARIDLLVLRIGAYELLNHKDVPAKVVINEAVELAKAFGGDNSSKFINGVLGTLLRKIDPKEGKARPKKAKVGKVSKK